MIASVDNRYCILAVVDPGKDVADAIFQSAGRSQGATFAAEAGHPTLDDHADRSMEQVMWQNRDWVITTAVAYSPGGSSGNQLNMMAAPVPPAPPASGYPR